MSTNIKCFNPNSLKIERKTTNKSMCRIKIVPQKKNKMKEKKYKKKENSIYQNNTKKANKQKSES